MVIHPYQPNCAVRHRLYWGECRTALLCVRCLVPPYYTDNKVAEMCKSQKIVSG